MADISRRVFLGAAAAGAAAVGLSLAGCAADNAPGGVVLSDLPETWDFGADVIVLGAGLTGLSAACTAAEAGASVLVIDADVQTGGTSALSGGVIQAAGTRYQKEFTDFQDDTPEKHAACYLEQAEHLADETLVKAICARAPERIDWLADKIGMKWVSVYGNNHVPYVTEGLHADRIHIYEGGGGIASGGLLTNAQEAYATGLGVEFRFRCRGEHLIYDGANGVVGVLADDDGIKITIKANKGVVLATSGFDRNAVLARQLNPQQSWNIENGTIITSVHSNGDGILMGLELNAALATVGGCIDFDGVTGQGTANNAPQLPCIFINGSGHRFVCEDATYAYMMRAIFQQERLLNKPTYMILDQNMIEQGIGPWGSSEAAAAATADGTLIAADTLEDLAVKLEVPAASLVGALESWNASIAATDEDIEFGRDTQLILLDKPPYYAHRNTPLNLGSLGGLMVNANAEVIDNAGNVIPRLYAGGMNSGGWYGEYYPGSGTALMGCVVLGSIAGEQAAAASDWA